MDADKILKELEEVLPEKVDYAEMVSAPLQFYGMRYVWEDPECYIIQNGIDLIKQQKSELATARAKIAELEAEVASREQSGIEEHNEVHYWRDRARKAESDLSAPQSHDKEAMELLEYAFGFLKKLYGSDTAHLDRYEALKAQSNERTD